MKRLIKFLKTWALSRLLWMFWPSILLLVAFLYLTFVYTYSKWKAISGTPVGYVGTTWHTLELLGWLFFIIIPFVQLAYLFLLARLDKEED